jgi:mannose-6-phosphate isomerase-like protein (cupin superfamily)
LRSLILQPPEGAPRSADAHAPRPPPPPPAVHGGGPPPHIHRHEDETFYIVEGRCDFLLGDETISCGAGDFVNVPRGTLHRFHNAGATPARMILTFTPAGIERFFEETLERALSPDQPPPDNVDEVAARYAAAAPRYGIEFVA